MRLGILSTATATALLMKNKLIQTNDKTRERRGTVADPVSLIIIWRQYLTQVLPQGDGYESDVHTHVTLQKKTRNTRKTKDKKTN